MPLKLDVKTMLINFCIEPPSRPPFNPNPCHNQTTIAHPLIIATLVISSSIIIIMNLQSR